MIITRKANIIEVLADSGLFAECILEKIEESDKAELLTNYEWQIEVWQTSRAYPETRYTPFEPAEYDIDYPPEKIAAEVCSEIQNLFVDDNAFLRNVIGKLTYHAVYQFEERWQEQNLAEAISEEAFYQE